MNFLLCWLINSLVIAAGYGLREESSSDVAVFYKIAKKQQVVSDKFTRHAYQEIYGRFLMPLIRRKKHLKEKIYFMEIGFGCRMHYGPGASALLWKELFDPTDVLWFAEGNKPCVEAAAAEGKLDGFHVVVGDQANKTTVREWVRIINTTLDVIIDDGGHHANQGTLPSILKIPSLRYSRSIQQFFRAVGHPGPRRTVLHRRSPRRS